MGILIIRQDEKMPEWLAAFKVIDSSVKVVDFREPHDKESITMALVWKQAHGYLSQYPNLKCVASMGAGVDFIFKDPSYCTSIPMTRVVDPMLITDMEEFVTAQVYAHLKGLYDYKVKQHDTLWSQQPYLRKKDVTIGVMGLGVLGAGAASALERQGFKVQGWSVTKKNISGVKSYDEDHLNTFLSRSNILICLLPLTPTTEGILNIATFSALPKGAFLIHVARGPHLLETDLLKALNSGQLSGAAIDVFHHEPLNKAHVFWKHPKVHITPHCASISSPESVVPQILANYNALMNGQPLLNQVNTEKGY
jgi:glyoxylate/hydroxypyruvate reductase A